MKRILALALSLVILFAMATAVFAANYSDAATEAKFAGRLIKQDRTLSTATISDIDALIHKRNEAILRGNEQEASKLEEELYALGARKSTQEEIMAFADKPSTFSTVPQAKNTDFVTSSYFVFVNGRHYEVERIDALPTTASNLFHSATVNNKKTSTRIQAGSLELCKVLGSAAAEKAIPIFDEFTTAYEALHSVISGFSPTTVVYGITGSYVCAALEQVSFYRYKNPKGYWTPFATSSYIQTSFTAVLFSTDYSGGSKQGLQTEIDPIKNIIYSPYSYDSREKQGYNTADILDRYFTSYLVDKKSQVTGVIFYHRENDERKEIISIGMVCPTTTSDIT